MSRDYKISNNVTVPKQAQTALQETIALPRAILDSANYTIISTAVDGTILTFNTAAERLLGYAAIEVIGKASPALIHDSIEVVQRAQELSQELGIYIEPGFEVFVAKARRGEVEEREWSYIRKDGSRFPVLLSVTALRDAEGNITGFLGIGSDITDRKRTEEALRESQERFRSAFDYAAIGMALVAPDGSFLKVNRSLCRIVGYSEPELLATTFQAITHPDDLDTDLNYVRQMLAGEIRDYQMEKRYFHASGQVVWILLSVSLVYDTQRQPLYFIAQIQDISDRKQAEAALHRREQEFRALVENTPDVIARFNRELRYVYLNRAVEKATGVPAATFIGKTNPAVGMPAELCSLWEEKLRLVFETAQEHTHEFEFPTPDGPQTYQARLVPEFSKTGSLESVLVISRNITTLKQAEEALRLSEAHYRSLVEAIPQIVWVCDADGQGQDGNQRWFEYTGRTMEQAKGWRWLEVLHPDDVQPTITCWMNAVKTGMRYEIEYRMKRASDGEYRWHLAKAEPLRDEHGRILRWFGTCTDITDRKQAEAVLTQLNQELAIRVKERTAELRNVIAQLQKEIVERQRAQAELDRIFHLSPDLISIAGSDGYFKRVNPAVEGIFGYTSEEFLSQPWMHWVHPEDQAATLATQEQLIERGETILSFENRYLCKDGSYKWLSWTSVPVLSEGLIYGIARDITQHKQAEAEIKRLNQSLKRRAIESETRYQQIVELAEEGIWVIDSEAVTTYVNQAMARMLGYTEAQMLGRPLFDFMDEEAKEQASANVEARKQGIAEKHEFRLKAKDGKDVWTYISTSPVMDEGGKMIWACALVYDITERKLSEQKLQQLMNELKRSNQELEQFAYVASHDLQEPLRAVAGYTQLLEQEYQHLFDESAQEYLTYIVDGAMRMQQLIQDLLEYSRVGTRGQAFAPIDCHVVLGRALDNLQVAIAESHATITHDSLPTVNADRTQLVQLFQNLIGNALKFRRKEEPPQVCIRAELSDRQWLFSVHDNGIGIKSEYLERIFVIFKRLHTRREFPGTGIGLSICKKIVERHGGHIWAESQLGVGTTIYFTLPLTPHPSLDKQDELPS